MRKCLLGHGVIFVIGIGLISTGMRRDRIFFLGLVIVLLGVASLCVAVVNNAIRSTNRPADVAYELGYQMGYDRGYMDGRKTSRPVVVPMQRVAGEPLSVHRVRDDAR